MADTAGSDSNNAPKRQRPKVSKTASSDGPAASKQLKRGQARESKQATCRNDKTSRPKTPATGSTTHEEGGGAEPEPKSVLLVLAERGAPMGGIGAA